MRIPLPVLLAVGCVDLRVSADPSEDWFDPGEPFDVMEPVAFTDVNYDFTGEVPIGSLPIPGDFETWFAPEDAPAENDCQDWAASDTLPAEIEGIVTILPRFYYKTSGCLPNFDVDSDEKYYGSYFVQDASGGFFVLGDSKVAHFDNGDRVRMKVRGVKESYDSVMIAVHDIVEVERGPEPIFYEAVSDVELGFEHVARVVRIEGTVASDASTFGEVYLCGGAAPEWQPLEGQATAPCLSDDAPDFKVSIDQELSRRGVVFAKGTRLQATGPVLYSFSEFQIVIMRIGQLAEL